jgi:hypothetical protein
MKCWFKLTHELAGEVYFLRVLDGHFSLRSERNTLLQLSYCTQKVTELAFALEDATFPGDVEASLNALCDGWTVTPWEPVKGKADDGRS